MITILTLFRATYSLIHLTLVMITIPLSFDIGGRFCGLAFSFTLVVSYFILSTFRILSGRTKLRHVAQILYYLHTILIPALLIFYLSLNTANSNEPVALQRLVMPWDALMQSSAPFFNILEGFCTLLFIQTIGQVSKWLVHRKSDSWEIVLLISAGCVISATAYNLYLIYIATDSVDLSTGTLAGMVLTLGVCLSSYGVISRKGSSLESSLILAYTVYCLYFIFRKSTTSEPPVTIEYSTKQQYPPLPPLIMDSYSALAKSFASIVPSSFTAVFDFFYGAISTITPHVFISLSFRIGVFYAATRIIPGIHYAGGFTFRYRRSYRRVFILYAYAPCVIIAVYTHLIMQNFDILHVPQSKGMWDWSAQGNQLWAWVGVLAFLALYAVELSSGGNMQNEFIRDHWKEE
ncbi:hypothetical protein CJU90_2606 [Yarrowia sp. C11]|nr:hypothetical protein CKK34_4054 [Yarrowia sp. E02]KAG5369159.1 hypothetical protein CJU90_2606 [Yarrowia sp. C11]